MIPLKRKRVAKEFKIKIISKGRLNKKKTAVKKVAVKKTAVKKKVQATKKIKQPIRELKILVHRLTAGEIAEHETFPIVFTETLIVRGQGGAPEAIVEKEKKVLQKRN